jgi:protease I
MLLKGKRIALLVEADYQDMEVHYPRYRLIEEGAVVVTIGTGSAGKYTGKWGYPVAVDMQAGDIDLPEFDGVVIPGGWAPDKMRLCRPMLDLVRELDAAEKPIGCICHGGWVLASAGVAKGRKLTSYEAIRDDLVNAGAVWSDAEVVVDRNLVTSRKPDDLPAFMRELIKLLAG